MKKIIALLVLVTITTIGTAMADSEIKTKGVHHIGLAVKDLQTTYKFFTEALNFKKVDERPDYPAIFVTDGTVLVTLWQADEGATEFDRKTNLGLHHLAFGVSSFEELDAAYEKIKNYKGVKVEFAPEMVGKGPARHMIFREPGGIRLELFANPSK